MIGAILDIRNDAGKNGSQREEAALLALELANARGGVTLASGERRALRLVIYDDGGDPERADLALRRLIQDDRAVAVLGPSSPRSVPAARRASEAAGVPLLALDSAGEQDLRNWKWTFSLAVAPEEALAATLDFLAASSVDHLGWLAPSTIDSGALRRTLGQLAAQRAIQVVAEESYPPGEEEYGPRLSRLLAENPRVILGWPRSSQEAADIARYARAIPGLVPVFLGPGAANDDTLTTAGDASNGLRTALLRLQVSDDLWDHDALTPVVRDFRRELELRTRRAATAEAAGAWDAVRVIVEALDGTTGTRAAARDALESLSGFPGASGPISFGRERHAGLDRTAVVIARADSRRWRLPP